MAEAKIQWCDYSMNPWIGCQKVAPGCKHCYAESFWDRFGVKGFRRRTSDSTWKHVKQWNRDAAKNGHRPRVFCASLADVFEDYQGEIRDHRGNRLYVEPHMPMTMADVRRDLFALIDETPDLDWLLLTKRPENIRDLWPKKNTSQTDEWCNKHLDNAGRNRWFYRDNVWIGTSVSEQHTADRNIPELLKCRDLAPVLFVSYEPALGPVDFSVYLKSHRLGEDANHAETGAIAWLIIGGESGADARPFNLQWGADTLKQCREAGVPAFFKQAGSNVYHQASDMSNAYPVHLKDKKGGDLSELPNYLHVRQWPEVSFAS